MKNASRNFVSANSLFQSLSQCFGPVDIQRLIHITQIENFFTALAEHWYRPNVENHRKYSRIFSRIWHICSMTRVHYHCFIDSLIVNIAFALSNIRSGNCYRFNEFLHCSFNQIQPTTDCSTKYCAAHTTLLLADTKASPVFVNAVN